MPTLFHDAWKLAIEALCWIELKRMSERLSLLKASEQLGINDFHTMGFAYKLVLETIRRKNLLDHVLNIALKPDSIDYFPPRIRAFLRLYTYEAKVKGGENYERAVNIAGVVRSIIGWRKLQQVEEALGILLGIDLKEMMKGLKDSERVSLKTFQPLWFVDYCFKLLGRQEAIHFLESMISSTPTYIRINTLKLNEERLLEKLSAEGITLKETEDLTHTYEVDRSKIPLVRTHSFKEGLFFIQDKASCLTVEVADPKPGMTILDVCAAPGAKSSYMAQQMENQGTIYSVDYSQRRIRVLKREIKRMGVIIDTPIVGDSFNPLPFQTLKADIVLLDPPCSSTGAFARMPSAKWRLSKRSIRKMAIIQWKMINNCAEFVKKNGHLIYSTCSITLEEDENIIERFLKWNPEFKMSETKPQMGIPGFKGQILSQRLYPHIHRCNGYFIAKLSKQG